MSEIIKMLERLTEMRAQLDLLKMDKKSLIERAIPPEVKQTLADIEAECQPMIEQIETEAAALEGEIETSVIESGASVKGEHLHAVFNRGRVTWDGKQLEGMMALVPGLAAARKEGMPSVTIRKI